jgi:hypothetical protein
MILQGKWKSQSAVRGISGYRQGRTVKKGVFSQVDSHYARKST